MFKRIFSFLFSGKTAQRKRICITTYFDEKFSVIGELCYKSILKYAKKHNMDAVLLQNIESSRPLPWHKILVIKKLFAAHYDYVVWIDADAVFVDYTINIAAELEEGKDLYLVKHFIDSKDVPNTGIMVIRNSDWSKQLLDMIWSKDEYLDHKWWENAALIHILGYHSLLDGNQPDALNQELLKRIKWLGGEWNAIPGVCEVKQPIIHHYAGMPLEQRIANIIRDFKLHSGEA